MLGKRKSIVVMAMIVMITSILPVYAQEAQVVSQKAGAVRTFIPVVSMYHVVGSGVAINPSDLDEFALVRMIAGRIKIVEPAINETRVFRMGVLILDNERYILKNATAVNGTFAAEIYSNNTAVGVVELHMVMKGDRIVWVGEIIIGDKEFKAYILEMQRAWNRGEIVSVAKKNKQLDVCERNPASPECKSKLVEWCKDHTSDVRCRAILMQNKEYREQFRKTVEKASMWCKEHPMKCKEIAIKLREHHPVAGSITNEKINRIKEMIRNFSEEESRHDVMNPSDVMGRWER